MPASENPISRWADGDSINGLNNNTKNNKKDRKRRHD